MKNLLYWISGFLPARLIKGDDGELYLERYFIARLFGCDVYLHRFIASDPDKGFHNHPWIWASSWVLCGGYWELQFDPADAMQGHERSNACLRHIIRGKAHWRRRFSAVTFRSDHLHRVVLEPGRECWTLFVAGPRTPDNVWGFLTGSAIGCAHVVWVFSPYTKSPSGDWWKSAPRGRDIARAPI